MIEHDIVRLQTGGSWASSAVTYLNSVAEQGWVVIAVLPTPAPTGSSSSWTEVWLRRHTDRVYARHATENQRNVGRSDKTRPNNPDPLTSADNQPETGSLYERALATQDDGPSLTDIRRDNFNRGYRQGYNAALDAIRDHREPSDEILIQACKAANQVTGLDWYFPHIAAIWKAILDAVLAKIEKTRGPT